MKRYSQPKAGTNDKIAKTDMKQYNINPRIKSGNILESLQYLYRGVTDNEWQ